MDYKQKNYIQRQSTIIILAIMLMVSASALCQQKHEEKNSNLETLDYPQSLADLLKRFEGRVIYIDLMASWCKPCIAELKSMKKHESYFEDNNIVKIYITIDNKGDIEKGIQMVQKESLTGYFASYHPIGEPDTSSTFGKDIEALFMTDEKGNFDLSIPKYAIANKKGEIVVRRAERPSNFTALKQQLEAYLN